MTKKIHFWTLVSTISASSMGFLSHSTINFALPTIQREMQATGGQLLWVVNAYILIVACLILAGGALGDRYGRNKIFGIGIWVFVGAAIVCSVTRTITTLIIFRFIQGIGGALLIPGPLAIIAANFSKKERGSAVGLWAACTSAVSVGGPIIGGWLVSAGIWRAIFYINIPFAIVALIPLYRFIPESKGEAKRSTFDYLGVALISAALFIISYALINAGQTTLSTQNGILVLVGIGLLLLFVYREAKCKNPVLPLTIFKSKQFSGTFIYTLLVYMILQGVFFFFVFNLIHAQSYSEKIAGIAFVPFSLQIIIMSRIAGKIADKYGPRLPMMIGSLLLGLGMIGLAIPDIGAGSSAYWQTFFIPLIVAGIGLGMLVTPLSTAVINSVDTALVGTASGINNSISQIAGVLGITILGACIFTVYRNTLFDYTELLNLAPAVKEQIVAEAQNFTGAAVPDGVGNALQSTVELNFRLSFLRGFRIITVTGAILAWISAGIAFLFIQKKQ